MLTIYNAKKLFKKFERFENDKCNYFVDQT